MHRPVIGSTWLCQLGNVRLPIEIVGTDDNAEAYHILGLFPNYMEPVIDNSNRFYHIYFERYPTAESCQQMWRRFVNLRVDTCQLLQHNLVVFYRKCLVRELPTT